MLNSLDLCILFFFRARIFFPTRFLLPSKVLTMNLHWLVIHCVLLSYCILKIKCIFVLLFPSTMFFVPLGFSGQSFG